MQILEGDLSKKTQNDTKKEKQKRTKLGGRDFRGEGCCQDWRIESDGKERTEKSPYSTDERGNF